MVGVSLLYLPVALMYLDRGYSHSLCFLLYLQQLLSEWMMFDNISQKITSVFSKLGKATSLTEEHIDAGLREIRIALLEADVSLEVVRDFVAQVKTRALGANVLKSISPQQTLIKVVHDYLVEVLSGEPTSSQLESTEKNHSIQKVKVPKRLMLVGLQGAGKTSTAAKLAHLFKQKHQKKVLLCSLDIYRPAAYEQLCKLAHLAGCDYVSWDDTERDVLTIARKAIDMSAQYDSVIFDTAGRLQIDDMKMDELKALEALIRPDATFLVCDLMLGSESYAVAKAFSDAVTLRGVVLTRTDSEARGGVALSMRIVTGCAINFLGTGEKLDNLEVFDPRRIADRLLGMGDVVSLVEKAQEAFSESDAETLTMKMLSGNITLADLEVFLSKMNKMGPLSSLIKMIPGVSSMFGKSSDQDTQEQDNMIRKNLVMLSSMTRKEKENCKIIDGSRRRRIAMGSGTTVQDVNALLRQYQALSQVLKQMKGGAMRGLFANKKR